jgi:lipopolysaccharide transport system ATP-binding protein
VSEIAIRVDNLSKRYIIDHQRDSRDGLRHVIQSALASPFKWFKKRRTDAKLSKEEFWALRDVSFEIEKGDTVGIIGRNGAGKSTLLKILSRITHPTAGQVTLNGRVASLLEVGTGFHQELTGRENIFLNGAILGMTRAEIRRKFDEIVAFAEVDRFLDTPVKRYSSGMYVRLAFAVAAHLEPEILIVDEVLAVGDAAFQKKCLGKMGEAAKGGRTVLFVSHNMPAVQTLCRKAIYLDRGKVKESGDVSEVTATYTSDTAVQHRSRSATSLGPCLKLEVIEFSSGPIESGDSCPFRLRITCEKATSLKELSLIIESIQGTRVAIIDLRSLGLPVSLEKGDTWEVDGEVDSVPFVEGDYSVGSISIVRNSGRTCSILPRSLLALL